MPEIPSHAIPLVTLTTVFIGMGVWLLVIAPLTAAGWHLLVKANKRRGDTDRVICAARSVEARSWLRGRCALCGEVFVAEITGPIEHPETCARCQPVWAGITSQFKEA